MKLLFCYLLTPSTMTLLLLIPYPCSCDRTLKKHLRGQVPFPKTIQVWSEKLNKTVTAYMEPSPDVEILFNPEKDIKYYIHKKNVSKAEKIDLENINSTNKDIDPKGDWYFGIHGWMGDYNYSPIINKLVTEIHGHRTSNIIHVDWAEGADSYYYPTAAANVKKIGGPIAKVINNLVEKGLAKKDTIHLIGFSLGGHGVGFVGKSVSSKYGWKLQKITGLDPAGPSFDDRPPKERIDKTDGEYVEVFHTCGDMLGLWKPAGHVDVYVNKGTTRQPGCGYLEDIAGSCSHQFAKKVYGEYTHLHMKSYRCISFKDFVKGRCNDDVNTPCGVGFKYPNCKEGVYHLISKNWFT